MIVVKVVVMITMIIMKVVRTRNLQRRQRSAPGRRPLSEKPIATQSLWFNDQHNRELDKIQNFLCLITARNPDFCEKLLLQQNSVL